MESAAIEDDPIDQMSDLMEDIGRLLSDKPDDVFVESEDVDDETVLHLVVPPDDIGRVLGRQGRTARSLRTILAAASAKTDHRFKLDIEEDGA